MEFAAGEVLIETFRLVDDKPGVFCMPARERHHVFVCRCDPAAAVDEYSYNFV